MLFNFTLKVSDKELAELKKLQERNYIEMIQPRSVKDINVRSVTTIIFEEIQRNCKVWVTNIFSPFLTAVIYFLVFGIMIGTKIGMVNNLSYLVFIIPGFLIMNVLGAAYGNGVYPTFSRKFFKSIQYVQVAPLSSYAFVLGITIASILRGFVIAILIWLAGLLISGEFHLYSLLGTFVTITLVCSIFSLLGQINGIFANSWEQINFVPTFIITPLTYLSGIFFDINKLPSFFASLSQLNPIAHVVSAVRYSLLGQPETNLLVSLSFLGIICIGLFFYVSYLVRKHLNII